MAKLGARPGAVRFETNTVRDVLYQKNWTRNNDTVVRGSSFRPSRHIAVPPDLSMR